MLCRLNVIDGAAMKQSSTKAINRYTYLSVVLFSLVAHNSKNTAKPGRMNESYELCHYLLSCPTQFMNWYVLCVLEACDLNTENNETRVQYY